MTQRQDRLPLWLVPNLLSLDAPVIALLWQGFLAASMHVSLTFAGRAVLGLAVWSVYIADRLLDVRRHGNAIISARHRFHQEHPKLMAGLLAVAISGAAVITFLQARIALVRGGAVVAVCVLLYFALIHRANSFARVPKEIAVALVFACGIILAPWTRTQYKESLLVEGAALFLACVANTVAIEVFEWRRLRQMRGGAPHPLTIMIGRHYAAFCATAMAGCTSVFAIQAGEARPILLAVALSVLALLCLVRIQHRLSPDAFRVLADAALLSPIPVWLLWPA